METMIEVMRIGEESFKSNAKETKRAKLEVGACTNFQCPGAMIMIEMKVEDSIRAAKLEKLDQVEEVMGTAENTKMFSWSIKGGLKQLAHQWIDPGQVLPLETPSSV